MTTPERGHHFMPEHRHEHEQEHSHEHQGLPVGDDPYVEMLDLDGEVLADHLTAVTAWVEQHRMRQDPAGPPVRRILDLGSGTGTGTFALLRRFPAAEIITVDASGEMLGHLTSRARKAGVDGRVRPQQIDLDTDRLAAHVLDPIDVVWASASMHHMARPADVLTDLRQVLSPGGQLAMIEFETFPRFLPGDIGLGTPGLEERCNAVADRMREAHHRGIGSDWADLLVTCGFDVREETVFTIDVPSPLPPAALRYAWLTLSRLEQMTGPELDATDRATLTELLRGTGPHRLAARTDLRIRSSRRAWMASPK